MEDLTQQPETAEGTISFPLDEATFEVFLHTAECEMPLGHRMRRPTKQELTEREQQVTFEQEDVSKTETRTNYDGDKANRQLWDKIILFVQGYEMGGDDPTSWRPADEVIRKVIPSPHKAQAIAGLYDTNVEIDRAHRSMGFKLLGAIEVRLVQEIANQTYRIVHVLRRPTEGEWLAYQAKAVQAVEVKGAKRRLVRYRTNLSAACELYDVLLERLQNVTIGGEPFTPSTRGAFLSAMDATYKQLVIAAFASDYGTDLRD